MTAITQTQFISLSRFPELNELREQGDLERIRDTISTRYDGNKIEILDKDTAIIHDF